MDPDSNRFVPLTEKADEELVKNQTREMQRRLRQMQKSLDDPGALLRPNGQPVPKHWSVFTVGEDVVIKDYTFRVAYVGETNILFEPVGPLMVGGKKAPDGK